MTPLRAVRAQPAVLAALLAAAGLAWWWSAERMAGMDAAPGTALGTVDWFTGSWVLMMAAMMLPSFAPTLMAHLPAAREQRAGRGFAFAAGYLLTWTAAGVLAYGLIQLGMALFTGQLAWQGAGRWLSAATIILAALYELAPLKQACLQLCRSRLVDRRSERQSWPTAFVLGMRSGVWCIGCSWALMAALFALGVMSLIWMALIAALIALQKTSARPAPARIATALILAVLALGILIAPGQVPGFVLPGAEGMHAMNAMS